MGFLKKLKFWKKKWNVSSGENETRDAKTQTELTSTLDVSIQVVSGDNNKTCQGSSQTEGWNERVLKRQLQELKDTLVTYECRLRSENRQIERLEEEVAVYKAAKTATTKTRPREQQQKRLNPPVRPPTTKAQVASRATKIQHRDQKTDVAVKRGPPSASIGKRKDHCPC